MAENGSDEWTTLHEDDPERGTSAFDGDPDPPAGPRRCLTYHDPDVEPQFVSPDKARLLVKCPRCPDRTLFYTRWRKGSDEAYGDEDPAFGTLGEGAPDGHDGGER